MVAGPKVGEVALCWLDKWTIEKFVFCRRVYTFWSWGNMVSKLWKFPFQWCTICHQSSNCDLVIHCQTCKPTCRWRDFFRNESETFRHNRGPTLILLFFKTLRDYIQTKTYKSCGFSNTIFFYCKYLNKKVLIVIKNVNNLMAYQKRAFSARFFVLFVVSPILWEGIFSVLFQILL